MGNTKSQWIRLFLFQSHYWQFNPTLCKPIPLFLVYIYHPTITLLVYTHIGRWAIETPLGLNVDLAIWQPRPYPIHFKYPVNLKEVKTVCVPTMPSWCRSSSSLLLSSLPSHLLFQTSHTCGSWVLLATLSVALDKDSMSEITYCNMKTRKVLKIKDVDRLGGRRGQWRWDEISWTPSVGRIHCQNLCSRNAALEYKHRPMPTRTTEPTLATSPNKIQFALFC